MCKKVFICIDDHAISGTGDTLIDAYDECKENGEADIEDCTFYEATEIKVKLEIKQITVPVKKG